MAEEYVFGSSAMVKELTDAIEAYNAVMNKPGMRQLERMLSDAAHNRASALANVERKGEEQEKVIWQGIVAEKDMRLAEKDREIARLRARNG